MVFVSELGPLNQRDLSSKAIKAAARRKAEKERESNCDASNEEAKHVHREQIRS